MGIDDAVQAHFLCRAELAARWTLPCSVASAGECKLMSWLSRNEASLGHLPEFGMVKFTHDTFRRIANELVTRVKKDQAIDVNRECGAHTDLGAASSSCVTAFRILQHRVRKADYPKKR